MTGRVVCVCLGGLNVTGFRMRIFTGGLGDANHVVIFEEHTAHDLIRAVSPDIYVKGGDYAPEEIVEFDLLTELGIEVQVLAHRPGLGSSALIERIRTES